MDYETLRVVWWLILGVLLIGFAITDGFDLGVAAILPYVGRTDEERRALLGHALGQRGVAGIARQKQRAHFGMRAAQLFRDFRPR